MMHWDSKNLLNWLEEIKSRPVKVGIGKSDWICYDI
jgi:hypothetical protein